MKENLVNLLITLASVLITAAIASLAKWQQSQKDANYKSNIDMLRDAIDAAVQSMQHSVEDLKSPHRPGTWDAEAKAFVQKRVLDVAGIMAKPAIDALVSKFGMSKASVEKLMMSFLEASVFAHKMTKLEVFEQIEETDSGQSPDTDILASKDN